jgi:rRNA maturation endonuclease Nob1
MTYSVSCMSCSRRINLQYDEADSTPEFCPYCGEPLDNDLGDYAGGPENFDEWNDEDDR